MEWSLLKPDVEVNEGRKLERNVGKMMNEDIATPKMVRRSEHTLINAISSSTVTGSSSLTLNAISNRRSVSLPIA